MTLKDLKVGMKVWIREDLKGGTYYDGLYFHPEMEQLAKLNKPFEVLRVGKEDVAIAEKLVKGFKIRWFLNNAMIDWKKTIEENSVIMKSNLVYDRTSLSGKINGKEIKVIRSPEDEEDLEKAVMMGLIKSLGYTYKDVKELENKIKTIWRPQENEKYYFVTSCGAVVYTYNYDSQLDKALFDFGNYFKTEEEANQKAIEVRQLFKIIGGLK